MLRPAQLRTRGIAAINRWWLAATILLVIAVAATVIIIPFPLNAVAIAAPLAGVLLLFYPILLPLGFVASVPIQDAIPVPEEIPVTATRLMTVAVFIVVPLVAIRLSEPFQWSRFLLAIVILLTTFTVSLWSATHPAEGFAEIYQWTIAGLAFWLTMQFVRSRSEVIVALSVVGVLALILGAIGGIQALSGMGPASFQIGDGFSRAFGSFGMPNSYAAYLEMATLPLLPVALWSITRLRVSFAAYWNARVAGYLASTEQRRMLVISSLFALVMVSGATAGLVGIALSFSRGGWLGTIAGLLVIAILLGRRALISSLVLAAVFSLGVMAWAPGPVLEVVGGRFTQLVQQAQIGDIRGIPVTGENFATVERMAHWKTAVAMWDQHPWLGVGAGNFNERFTEFSVHPRFAESQGHAHNYYLHLMAETGLIGLAAYLGLLIATFVIGWRAFRSSDDLSKAIGIGSIGLSVALAVHNLFENLHVLNISVQMMFIWALATNAFRWRVQPGDDSNQPERLLYDSHRLRAGRMMQSQSGRSAGEFS